MLSFRSTVFAALGVAVLTAFSGCGDDSGGPEKSKTSPGAKTDATAAPQRPGFPALPKGAGSIDPDAPEEFTETDSGLKYRVLHKSDGRKPIPDDAVEANYKGWLDNGTQFDSSYDRGEAFRFRVATTGPRSVIPAWVEAVQLIGVGGLIEIEAPPDLAYGPQGRPPVIPPNATLHFIIELKDIR